MWPAEVYRYYFDKCSSELTHLIPLPFSRGWSTCYSNRLHDCLVTVSRCCKDVCVNIFFPRTDRLRPWNFLPIECLPLTYDVNDFKSRINTVNCRFFLKRFPVCFNLFVLPFLVTLCLIVAVQPCLG